MQALCGLQGIFDLFNCKTPALSQLSYVSATGYYYNTNYPKCIDKINKIAKNDESHLLPAPDLIFPV